MNHKTDIQPKSSNRRYQSRYVAQVTLFFVTILIRLTFSSLIFADSPQQPTLIHSDEKGVTLRWEFPATNFESETPSVSALIGLPPTGNATLSLVDVQSEAMQLPTSLSDKPNFAASLSEPIQIRYQRVARLTVNPVYINPLTAQSEQLRAITLQINFDDPAPRSRVASDLTDPIAKSLTRELVNPIAKNWTTDAVHAPKIQATTLPAETKITIDHIGFYALSYADLQSVGMPVDTLDPRQLQLTHGYPRQTVSVWVEGADDGHFNPGDRILFFAEPSFSRYTDDDAYFLSIGGSVARPAAIQDEPLPNKVFLPLVVRPFVRVENLPVGTATFIATAEENHFYDELYPDHLGDHWFWQKLDALGDRDINVSLILAPDGSQSATVHVWFQGVTAHDHRVQVAVNGHYIGDAVWSGRNAYQFEAVINGAILSSGPNTIGLTLVDTVGAVWLDAIQLDYPAQPNGGGQMLFSGEDNSHAYAFGGWQNSNPTVLDVTDPLDAKRVTNIALAGDGTLTIGDESAGTHRYFVAAEGSIASPKTIQPAQRVIEPIDGADYIIITHPAFADAVAPLAAHRAARGLRVATVTTDEIYDTFGEGRVSAEAIKTFLAHTFANWTPPAPAYVLLVGDGHYDFKNYWGWGNPNFVPPYLASVDPRNFYPWSAETAADNRFVTLTGSDNFPDMMIGRLSVNSVAEAQTVVGKIIGYESDATQETWRSRQLLVSDNCDVAGNFYNFNDNIYNNTSSLFISKRFYYPQDAGAPCVYNNSTLYGDTDSLRHDFLEAFNRGAGLVVFNGHSSWHQWAGGNRTTGSEASVFHWSLNSADNDVTHLSNGSKLPVVLGMTCFTGYFHHPEYPTLDESLLRQSGGGGVAVWGSTGLGVATGHDQLQSGFYDALTDDGERVLGALTLAGKAKLFANGFDQDLLDTFTLFGDPAFTMDFAATPYTNAVYLPLIL